MLGLAPSISFPMDTTLAASFGSHPPCFTSAASSAATCPGFILDGAFSWLAVSPASFFLDFPVPSAASSAAGAAPDDDDAVDACAAGVLDRNRCGVPLNAACSDATRRPVPLKGSGPELLLRPLVGLGITTVSMGVSAGVGSERSLFATLTEGPLLLVFAFAAGCAEGALLAGLPFIASSGAGG